MDPYRQIRVHTIVVNIISHILDLGIIVPLCRRSGSTVLKSSHCRELRDSGSARVDGLREGVASDNAGGWPGDGDDAGWQSAGRPVGQPSQRRTRGRHDERRRERRKMEYSRDRRRGEEKIGVGIKDGRLAMKEEEKKKKKRRKEGEKGPRGIIVERDRPSRWTEASSVCCPAVTPGYPNAEGRMAQR